MELDFKTRLKQREVLLGPLVTLGSTEVAEILSKVGFDWLWIEMEHAPSGLARVQEMIQATGGRVPCLVRAPWNDGVWIKRILDTGCDGIVIPQIRSAAERLITVLQTEHIDAANNIESILDVPGFDAVLIGPTIFLPA